MGSEGGLKGIEWGFGGHLEAFSAQFLGGLGGFGSFWGVMASVWGRYGVGMGFWGVVMGGFGVFGGGDGGILGVVWGHCGAF